MVYTIFINIFLKKLTLKSNTYEHDYNGNIFYDLISQYWTYFLYKHIQTEANLTILDLCRVLSSIDESSTVSCIYLKNTTRIKERKIIKLIIIIILYLYYIF